MKTLRKKVSIGDETMNIQHICFIAKGYPTNDDPVFTFVKQLVCAIAELGIKCIVIAPQSISNRLIRKSKIRPVRWVDTHKNTKIDIYQPKYISFSNIKIFGISITYLLWHYAVIRAFKKASISPTVLYGHFWHTGISAGYLGAKYKIPVFIASGESKISVHSLFTQKMINKYLKEVQGVICVSKKNMYESIALNLTNKDKTIILPNAIDHNKFYLENKSEVRKKLGLQKDDFIVAFTGTFSERKGVLRLSEAIKKLDDVKSIYIGSGNLKPEGEGILFCGKLPHDQIVHYLNAADVFVLPTLAEGCCNSIIEAMACGLPIISSNLSFNDDILNEQNSIRVDSNDIDQIANAIRYLKNNPEVRKSMSKASIEKAKELNITNRAKKIVEFISEMVNNDVL